MLRIIGKVFLLCFLLTLESKNIYAADLVKETEREYFSTGYKVVTEWNKYRKISAKLTLPAVEGLGEVSPLAIKKEAAYNYLGVEDKLQTIDFGFYKPATSKNSWKVFSFYVSKDAQAAEEAYNFITQKYPKLSSIQKNNDYNLVWSDYKEYEIPDNTKVFVQLFVSGENEITLNIKYEDKEIKIPYRFMGANNLGKGLRFRRESNLIAYGQDKKIDGCMETTWENLRLYDVKKIYPWLNEGFFYRDDANKANGIPLNAKVSLRKLPDQEIVSYK